MLGGDPEAFAALVDRHKRGILNFIGASIRSPEDAQDLAQETFLRAYAHLGTYNPALGKFSTWLYHIARNVVRTALDRQTRRPQVQELGEEDSLEQRLPDERRESNPEAVTLRGEEDAAVRAALEHIPERMGAALRLRYYANMEYAEIATTMGLSLGNVKTLIHRGKLALAHHLRDREAGGTKVSP
ncbi:MAG TPA: sigma-70 family RNA polymerase sigma factor [Candidatus Dormibacteraeota bacterium]|nr:sigma-70 family RNA polymerase sigma factor [Candidatus Dormibacteraeota bacterium]